jgi:hypothetical protein
MRRPRWGQISLPKAIGACTSATAFFAMPRHADGAPQVSRKASKDQKSPNTRAARGAELERGAQAPDIGKTFEVG